MEGFSGEEAVDEAGGEGISAADAVEDVDVALGDVGDLGGFESLPAMAMAPQALREAVWAVRRVVATALRLG